MPCIFLPAITKVFNIAQNPVLYTKFIITKNLRITSPEASLFEKHKLR